MRWETAEETQSSDDNGSSENEDEVNKDLEAYLYSLVHHEIDLQSYSLVASKLPFESTTQICPSHGNYEVSVKIVSGDQQKSESSNSIYTGSRDVEGASKGSGAHITHNFLTQQSAASSAKLSCNGLNILPSCKNQNTISETSSGKQTIKTNLSQKDRHSNRSNTSNVSSRKKSELHIYISSSDSDPESNLQRGKQKAAEVIQSGVGDKFDMETELGIKTLDQEKRETRITSHKTGSRNTLPSIIRISSSSSDSDSCTEIQDLAPWLQVQESKKDSKVGCPKTNNKKPRTEVVIIESDSSDSESLDCSCRTPICSKTLKKHNTPAETSIILLSESSDSDDSSTSSSSKSSVLNTSGKPKLDFKWNVDAADHQYIQTVEEENCRQKTETQVDQLKWKINEADEYGRGKASRYYSKFTVRCQNCNEIGHLSKVCPKPKKQSACGLCGLLGHSLFRCPNRLCYNCDQPGHVSQKCPNPRRDPNMVCRRCQRKGHIKSACPDQWRQHHVTSPDHASLSRTENKRNTRVYCCNCASQGHFAFECKEERMDRYSFAPYPFVTKYNLGDVARLQRERKKLQKFVDKQQNAHRGDKSERHTPKVPSLCPDTETPKQTQPCSSGNRPQQSIDTKSPKQTQPCSSGNRPHQSMSADHGGLCDRPSQGSLHSEMANRPHNYQGPKIKRKWTDTCSTEAYYYNESPPEKKKTPIKNSRTHVRTLGQEERPTDIGHTVVKGNKQWESGHTVVKRKQWERFPQEKKQETGKLAAKNSKQIESYSFQQEERRVIKSSNGFKISVANRNLNRKYYSQIH